MFTPSDTDGFWKLNSGYSVSGLQAGHFADVLVYRKGGAYALGITVYSVKDGVRVEAKQYYNTTVVPQVDGVDVSFVAKDNLYLLTRDLYIDFSQSVKADGTLNLDSDGNVVCGVYGLSAEKGSEHKITVVATDNGNGSYSFKVAVYSERTAGNRIDRSAMYVSSFVNLPAGCTASLVALSAI